VEQKREKTEEKFLGALGSAGACLLETNYGGSSKPYGCRLWLVRQIDHGFSCLKPYSNVKGMGRHVTFSGEVQAERTDNQK